MRFRFLALGAMCIVQACGGDNGTTDGGADGSPADGTLPQNDASSDVNGGNDTGTGSDTGTDGGGGAIAFVCGDASVSDCSMCDAGAEPCVYCETDAAAVVVGSCISKTGSCFNKNPKGFGLCPCKVDAGGQDCPPGEGFLICLPFGNNGPGSGVCDTCGSIPETNGYKCENGGSCNGGDGGCL